MTQEEKQVRTKLVLEVVTRNLKTLAALKGVVNAGAGFRTKGGKMTDEICIIAEVEKKVPRDQLSADQVVPPIIENIPVDVVEKPVYEPFTLEIPVEEAVNQNIYRPLVGGSQITNGKPSPTPGMVEVGTLGCMVYLPQKKHPYLAILSNHHVMYANGGADGDPIGQPFLSSPAVGNITTGQEVGQEVDFAIAKLASGVECTNNVLSLGTLTGFADAVLGERVGKYGRTTELTIGQVVTIGVWINPNPPHDPVYTGLVIYEGYPDITPDGMFGSLGDSGSVIVNNDNKVIGLLWGGRNAPPFAAYANDQRRLQQFGKFEIPVPTSVQMQQLFSDAARLDKYQRSLEKSPHGKEILSAFRDNVEEGIKLVNEQRECMVAWQRVKGPQFISLIKDLDTDQPYEFRRTVDGVEVKDMFSKMAMLFKQYGSRSMRTAIETYGEEVLSYVCKSKSVEQIIEYIVTA